MADELHPILTLVEQYRQQLIRNDTAAMNRLIEAYKLTYGRLSRLVDALLLQVERDGITPGRLVRMKRYKELITQTAAELQKFQALTSLEIDKAAKFGINIGSKHALGLMSAEITGNSAAVVGIFNRLPTETIESLLGFLTPGGTLSNRIAELAPYTAQAVEDALKRGVALGYNPRKIAGTIQDAYGRGLTDALRMTRTVQLWSYRESSRANYLANSDILDGWIWCAELDDRVCMSCVVQHGTIHPLDEPLDDHYNGRCAPIPVVKGFDRVLEDRAGEKWFDNLSAEKQASMMGPKYFSAWQDGKFGLIDLSHSHDDAVYGSMKSVTPLHTLVGE